MSPGVCVMCNKWTPLWHDASLELDHCPFSAIKDELLVHLGHLWVHHKHTAIETVSCGFKMSLFLLNCYNLVFQERKTAWPTPEGWVRLVHVLSLISTSFGFTGSNQLSPGSESIAQGLMLSSEEIFDGNNSNNWGENLIAIANFMYNCIIIFKEP